MLRPGSIPTIIIIFVRILCTFRNINQYNNTPYDYERNRFSRWFGYTALPNHKGHQQAAYPYLRQANDILSHLRAYAGGH